MSDHDAHGQRPVTAAEPLSNEASAIPDDHHADAHDAAAHDHGGRLGPIDWPAHGAGALGMAAGLVIAAAFALTSGLVNV